jgi:hypothetical protein
MFTAKVQSIAKYAALIGEEFNVDLLRAILPASVIDDESDLAASLHTLSEEGIIFLIAAKPPVYAFHNEIIRTTLYDFVLPSEASLVHQRIAQTMETMYRDDLAPYYAFLSYHFAMSPAEMKPRAFFYTVRSADLELSGADFAMSYMYLQYALTFMEFQNEIEVISKVVEGALADMLLYQSKLSAGGDPFPEEVLANFTKLKADLKAGIKAKKFNGAAMKQSGNEQMDSDDFVIAIKVASDSISRHDSEATSSIKEGDGLEEDATQHQHHHQSKHKHREQPKSGGGCTIS